MLPQRSKVKPLKNNIISLEHVLIVYNDPNDNKKES